MNTRYLSRVRQMFSSPYAPRAINRANQRKWVRAVRQLGDAWLLANPQRQQKEITA